MSTAQVGPPRNQTLLSIADATALLFRSANAAAKDVGNSSISTSDDNASCDGQVKGEFDDSNAESDEDTVGGVAMTSVNPLPPPPPHMLAGATVSPDIVAAAAAAAAAAAGGSGVDGSGAATGAFAPESPAMASVNNAEPVFGPDGARGRTNPLLTNISLLLLSGIGSSATNLPCT